MRVTTGVDIVEVKRIEEIIQQQEENFLSKVFTIKEIEYCNSTKAHKYESFAVRFAAKEAVFKALNVNVDNNYIQWQSIETIKEDTGRPKVILKGAFEKYNEQICNIDISLSHERKMAVASVAILWKD